MMSEEGEEQMSDSEMSEKPAIKQQESETPTADGEIDDDVIDEDNITTNVEARRDDAIRILLAKEDLGII